VDAGARGVDTTRQCGGRVTQPCAARARQRIEASYTDISGDFTNRFGTSSSGTHRFDTRVQEDLAWSPSLGGSAGLEVIRERGSSSVVTGSAGEELPIRRGVTGAFGELRF